MSTAHAQSPVAGRIDLTARYEARKSEVLGALRDFEPADCFDEAKVEHLTRGLHKLAGVAGLFGAARLGTLAAEGVDILRHASPERRPALVASLAAAMAAEGRR